MTRKSTAKAKERQNQVGGQLLADREKRDNKEIPPDTTKISSPLPHLFGIDIDSKWTVAALVGGSLFLVSVGRRGGYYGWFSQDVPSNISSLSASYGWYEGWAGIANAGWVLIFICVVWTAIWWLDRFQARTKVKPGKERMAVMLRRFSTGLMVGLIIPSSLLLVGNVSGSHLAEARIHGNGRTRIPNIDLTKISVFPLGEQALLRASISSAKPFPFIEIGRSDRGVLYCCNDAKRVYEIDPKDGVILNITPVKID